MNTIILRHRRENLRKCSLRGLETRSDLVFYTYPTNALPSLTNYIVLALNAPPITSEDAQKGLLLVDGTWNLAKRMLKTLSDKIETRSLPPGYKTAYPRRQTGCPNESEGLSSIEALYIAYKVLGRPIDGLLDNYYWNKQFLELNDKLHI
jgi:pre-rRNA-processing protein TSR3